MAMATQEQSAQMRCIETLDDIAEGLACLRDNDIRLCTIMDDAGPVPLRRREPGFPGLSSIIVAQQVSRQSADAIEGRLRQMIDPLTAENYLASGEDVWRAVGLSRPKQRTLSAVSEAIISGNLDLEHITALPPQDAIESLVAIKGIGPWTAEVYCLFCAGHRDIFPAGDLALQIAVHEALDLPARPDEKRLREIAESWAPWRGVAARLLWAWYGTRRSRTVMP